MVMDKTFLDMEAVTIEFDEETLEALDDVAFTEHRGNRDAAIRECLDRWLKSREKADD
jgi:metal-responsive CopG/Arc/MetJ family transcriptional regulator